MEREKNKNKKILKFIKETKNIIIEYLELKNITKYSYFENLEENSLKIKLELESNINKNNILDNELIKELDYKFEYCGFEKIDNFNKEKNTNNKIKYLYKLDKEKLKLSEEKFNSKIKLLFQKVEAYIKLNKRPQSPEEIPTDKNILEEKIVYWSEGNKYLEELLRISLENGYTTHACCGGHEHKKNFAYISYNLNMNKDKNYIFVNKVFKMIENKEEHISMYFEKENSVNVAFHANYGLQDKLFKNIIKIINEIKKLSDEEIKNYIFSSEKSMILTEVEFLENNNLNIIKNLILTRKKDENTKNLVTEISITNEDKNIELEVKEKVEKIGYIHSDTFDVEEYYYSRYIKQIY